MNKITRALGAGVGAAAEYRQHRKEQKLSRENSEQDESPAAGPSTSTRPTDRSISSPDALPAYTELPASGRSLASGKPATDDKKAALSQYDDEDDEDDDDDLSIVDDEMAWELDEAAADDKPAAPPSYEESEIVQRDDADLAREIVDKNATALRAAPEFERTPLPCPVILPQRRPRSKARGFVRAYAPLLGECSGISQDTFLTFLDNFDKASQASPVITVIQVSAMIAGFAPSAIAMAVTTAVQIAAGTAKEIQSRKRTNTFLDKMNDEMFKPAGLYAMIIKYKTEQEVIDSGNSLLARFGISGEKVDFNSNQSVAKYDRTLSSESTGSSESRSMSDRMKGLRLASGKTEGPVHLPDAAPLIFPNIDKAIAKQGPETFKDKSKDVQGFLGDYMDKRAQLRYAKDDPNSMLNVPENERAFKSKLADPNHPMYNGGLVGFVSGGTLTKYTQDHMRYRDQRRMLKYDRKIDRGWGLTHKQQRRYDRTNYAEDQYSGYDRGYDRGLGGGFDRGLGGGYGRRRRHGGGPIGLVGGLISAATNARGSGGRSMEYEDSYGARGMGGPYDDRRGYGDPYNSRLGVVGQRPGMGMRRSFDDRRSDYGNAPAPHAPYGGQEREFSDDRAPAPYARPGDSRGASYSGNQDYYRRQKAGGPLGLIKKVMTQDVLYLIIVNMPSEEELAEAREIMEAAKAAKSG